MQSGFISLAGRMSFNSRSLNAHLQGFIFCATTGIKKKQFQAQVKRKLFLELDSCNDRELPKYLPLNITPPKITTIKFSVIYNLGNMRSKMKNHRKAGLWKIIPSVSKFSRKINKILTTDRLKKVIFILLIQAKEHQRLLVVLRKNNRELFY